MIRKINDINIRNFYEGTETSITGTLTQTKLISIPIPANTFKAGDLITIDALFSKTGTAGIFTYRFFWNSSDILTGAIQIGVRSITNTQLSATGSRRLSIRTANGGGSAPEVGTEVIAAVTAIYSEYQSNTISNLALDWTIDSYVICAVTLGNTADSVFQQYMKIWTY